VPLLLVELDTHASGDAFVQFYDFEVLKGEEIIAIEPSVPLLDTRGAWPRIAKMSKRISLPGCRIRVRDQSGETIISY
jgi:hypothetical protein